MHLHLAKPIWLHQWSHSSKKLPIASRSWSINQETLYLHKISYYTSCITWHSRNMFSSDVKICLKKQNDNHTKCRFSTKPIHLSVPNHNSKSDMIFISSKTQTPKLMEWNNSHLHSFLLCKLVLTPHFATINFTFLHFSA